MGRHGLFDSCEAFLHVVDSMLNQHAKWLKVTRELPRRRKIAWLNYLLASHVWQQAHNGFTHQDPGFIDHVVNKKASIVRVSLPPDAHCLLSVWDHCLRSRHYVNVVDLMKLEPASGHPHGLRDHDFDSLFTRDKPIVFRGWATAAPP
jgi:xylulose-5-phosphate/fructose-6-phosphate phosphoketolase